MACVSEQLVNFDLKVTPGKRALANSGSQWVENKKHELHGAWLTVALLLLYALLLVQYILMPSSVTKQFQCYNFYITNLGIFTVIMSL